MAAKLEAAAIALGALSAVEPPGTALEAPGGTVPGGVVEAEVGEVEASSSGTALEPREES